MIFRASEHGFKASAFHKNCDNINDTLVLVRSEFDRTIGGYSHYKWNDERKDTNGVVNDSARKAFLIQLDLHQIYKPINDEFLITCNVGCGPVFGKGRDLVIAQYSLNFVPQLSLISKPRNVDPL